MAKGFKHGAGGVDPLNFKVVGGTEQPASPKENMIWVNTDQKITGWIFSSAQPEVPVDGLVWFSTEKSSPAGFNVLRKNGVFVYPALAKQCIDGQWKTKNAVSYLNGQWEAWFDGILYDYGNEAVPWEGGWAENEASFSIGSSGQNHYTREKIDLTAFTRLHCIFSANRGTTELWSSAAVFVASQVDANSSTKVASVTSDANCAEKEFVLDISEIEGDFYIGICGPTSYSSNCSASVHKVWLT